MKLLIVLALFVAVVCVSADPADEYELRDDFDVDEILNNERLLMSYTKCIREAGKCTPEGEKFKKWTPEIIQTSCAKCSERQKPKVARVIKASKTKLPQEWNELNKYYNPNGKYDASLEEFLNKYAS